ncbi:hypothetical protein LCGC14_0282740 [marine sediment metagenome]|uniref:Uncharacterized protein n=1 Tax=marine sediment metagenome TaxID=412755 RepID=A0A0F9TVQ2_9ZZZZ
MRHTYKLSVVGCNTGLLFESGRRRWQAEVTEPRVIEIPDAVFLLLPDEPDLPVGETVRIELGLPFTAETLDFISWKQAQKTLAQ